MKDFKLKASLFSQGISIPQSSLSYLKTKTDKFFVDDYVTTNGIILNFGNQYATVPINEKSQYKLNISGNSFLIANDTNSLIEIAIFIPPDYMKGGTIINGQKITTLVNTHLDRVRLQAIGGCANTCSFCSLNELPYKVNSKEDLEEALQIALSENNSRHILISGGSAREEDLEKLTDTYSYFSSNYQHLEPDVMTTPRGFKKYNQPNEYREYLEHLKQLGVFSLAVNFELNNEQKLKRFCPEKAIIGSQNYLQFIKEAVAVFGENKIRSCLIIGLEPLSETLKGVDKLARIGCNPVLSPYVPNNKIDARPSAELLIEAKHKSEEICDKHGVRLAPFCEPCRHNAL